MKGKCSLCGQEMKHRYNPMEKWGITGPICGPCYSKKTDEYYPGEHVRVSGPGD